MQSNRTITVTTVKRHQVVDITDRIREIVASSGIKSGLCLVHSRHTTARIVLNEAEPLLITDMEKYLADFIKPNPGQPFAHDQLDMRPDCPPDEPMNADSHLEGLFITSNCTLPVFDGRPSLGKWQAVMLVETDGPRERNVDIMVSGESKLPPVEEYLAGVKPLIVERMKSSFPFPEEDYPSIAEDIHAGMEAGKHLRGGLCVLISDALGGDRDRALDFAAAIDTFQYASLVHDDVIDEDAERRGRVSFWAKHGAKLAVIVGDRLFTLIKKRMLQIGNKPASIYVQAMDDVTGGVMQEVNIGEFAVDLVAGRVPKNLYQKIIRAKTGALFQAAAHLGAVAASVDEDTEQAFTDYGMMLGIAFQVADDLTDLAQLSKNTDRRESHIDKLVSVMLMGLHYERVTIKDLLVPVLKGQGIRDVLVKSGLDDAALADLSTRLVKANDRLHGISLKQPYGDLLRSFGRYAVAAILSEQNLTLEDEDGTVKD